MRQILVELPSKLLFFVALALALGTFVWGVFAKAKRKSQVQDGKPPSGLSSPTYFLLGAWLLMGMRGGGWIPSAAMFSKPWPSVPIFAYGVMLGLSLLAGWFLALKLAKQDGIGSEVAAQIYMWTAVWAIIGARILYIVANFSSFDHWYEALMLHKGGLVAYGGMIGGFLASWYGCWRRKIPLLKWADVSAPSVVLGTGITRIGCFLYGCDYGQRTDAGWGIAFPRDSAAWKDHLSHGWIASDAMWSQPVHPTQLYESAVGFALFGLLMWIRKHRTFSGQTLLAWVMGYGILRPLIEILRDDDQRGSVGPLSTSQFIGVASFTLALGLAIVLFRRHARDRTAMRYWETAAEGPPEGAVGLSDAAETGRTKPRKRK
ncbi:MAG: prolipoprotein diacylglyceryl transferase [Deltaproteobacteria bacterium]|nr:prolipoprotein diacylglyceryl transferase [Deltaproteobacteria bacterium]